MEAYQITPEEFQQLHELQLEMLIELDRICRKYQIKYSLDGGTLLGAIRHKGFIPWDDDIDVIMLREEYIKFKAACIEDMNTEKFFLQDYTTDKYYRWGYAKIRRNNTEFIRLGQERSKHHQGIFIDLFVVDNVPDKKMTRSIHHFLCFLVRKSLYSEVGSYSDRSKVKRIFYKIVAKIPRDFIFKVRNTLAEQCNKKRTELISHYTLEYPKRCWYGLPRVCFDEMIEVDFEGRKFLGFKEYDLYLTSYYGDYMTLPAVEKRIPHLSISKLKLVE